VRGGHAAQGDGGGCSALLAVFLQVGGDLAQDAGFAAPVGEIGVPGGELEAEEDAEDDDEELDDDGGPVLRAPVVSDAAEQGDAQGCGRWRASRRGFRRKCGRFSLCGGHQLPCRDTSVALLGPQSDRR